ncbi:MAG: trypsin-like peptidase domain-containing protein [Verrucomicrobiota bacterium]|jgi:S1-C subfamily serine protease
MLPRLNPFALALILCSASLAAPCRADELAEQGRAIFKKNQQAVVIVQLVLKISAPGMGGRSTEARQDATGTVIDPSGLTVLSLSSTDPSRVLESMMSGMADEGSRFKMETELSDVKILLQDGTEVPAEAVLRDKDLDLAFIRPKTKLAAPMAALDLTQPGKAEVLDQVIALNRLGSAAARAYAASVERISAIVTKPRLFYIPETTATTTTLGAPAFTLDGKLLGLFVTRSLKAASGSSMFGGMFGVQANNLTGIILPAEDILKAAKQVPAAGAAEEKKSAGAAEDKKDK